MSAPTDQQVAEFLRAHPGFFNSHVELLAGLSLPAAHGGRAISLQERQLEVMREKYRALERRLAEMIRVGQENDAIADRLQKWTRQLLLETDPARLPAGVAEGLQAHFSVPQTALRLWGLREAYRSLECGQPVAVEVISQANAMTAPFCGPRGEQPAARWLPEQGRQTGSVALLPLRKGVDPRAFGLVVLGSADTDRFQAGMGTAFLERIAEIASACLSRLVE